jgi:pyrroline-5-carboxylate reductase
MKKTRLAFIGAGNMARSLIGGLIADGWDAARISVSDPDETQLASLRSRFPVHTQSGNHELAETSEALVLAVKPQVIREVAQELAEAVQTHRPLVISIAAGVRAADLQRWLGGDCALVRCMPNTPALVQSGATALFATGSVDNKQKDVAESIMRAVGLALWIESEDLMDTVTALSGSGPAYFLLVMEALQEAGEALGLECRTAHLLALQTAFGAAKMALESNEDVTTLRHQVTSPGGTTERALAVLEDGGLRELFNQALTAARDRSREIAEQLGAA